VSICDKPETPQLVKKKLLLPSTIINTCDFTKILNKKKKFQPIVTIPELLSEIKKFKIELQNLKQAQQKESIILQHLLTKLES
jgi:hypothetical protein